MARKRKHSGRTMMDVVRESSSTSGMLPNSHRHMLHQPRHMRSDSSSVEPSRGVSTSNVSSNESSEATATSVHVKRVRGPNKRVADWGGGQKLRLELTTSGDIDGPDRVKFKTQLGVMARNTYSLPLVYESFDCMPRSILDDIWHEIKDNTNLPNEAKTVVLKDLNTKWRQGKFELKRDYYKPHMNDKEKLVDVPTCRIPPEQWAALVEFWELLETHEEAKRNTLNIAGYEFHHQLGRTPMLEVAKELVAENIEPSRIELFARSRARNGKLPLNENTRVIINQLKHAISQVPEQAQNRDLTEKIFTDFMGSDGHGRVRFMGQGITPSQYRNSFTLNDTLKKNFREEVIQEVRREMKDQIREETKEQLVEEMREQFKIEMKEQIAQEMARVRENITQEAAESVLSHFGLGHFPLAPLLANMTPFRTYENGQVGNNYMARGADLSGSTTSARQNDLITSTTRETR